MKKCPFCAEEIQDAAIKCRFCGSMLTGDPVPGVADSPPPPGGSPVMPAPVLSSRASLLALGLVALLVGIVAAILIAARGRSEEAAPVIAPSTLAATLAPSEPTSADYQFLNLPWNAGRDEVRAKLMARDFSYLQRDEDGDDQYQGRIEGRDAGIAAMYAGDKLARVMVVMLMQDDSGGLYTFAQRTLTRAYGSPARQKGLAFIWPERNKTLVWVTQDPNDHRTKINYESAEWPAEAKRRHH